MPTASVGRKTIVKRRTVILGGTLLGVTWIASMCFLIVLGVRSGFLTQEYVPTEDELRDQYDCFILENADVEGLYGYIDDPSEIFRYTVRDRDFSTAAILGEIEAKAKQAGFTVRQNSNETVTFERIRLERNPTVSLVKIVAVPRLQAVYVCSAFSSLTSKKRIESNLTNSFPFEWKGSLRTPKLRSPIRRYRS